MKMRGEDVERDGLFTNGQQQYQTKKKEWKTKCFNSTGDCFQKCEIF